MGGEEGEKTRRKDKYQKMLSYGSAQETWLLSSKAGLHLVWGRDTPEGDITWFGNQDLSSILGNGGHIQRVPKNSLQKIKHTFREEKNY